MLGCKVLVFRKLPIFHRGCITLHFYHNVCVTQLCHIFVRVWYSHTLRKVDILICVLWYITVIFIFISLVIDIENHFICLLAICLSSSVRYFFMFLAYHQSAWLVYCWVLHIVPVQTAITKCQKLCGFNIYLS